MNALFSRALGAAFVMLFMIVMERAAADRRRPSKHLATVGVLALALGARPLTAHAIVRVSSDSIGPGEPLHRSTTSSFQRFNSLKDRIRRRDDVFKWRSCRGSRLA
jgi:hypothetical protein